MNIGKNGIELLKQWEGWKHEAYKDSAGLLTIGCGHLLTAKEKELRKVYIDGHWIDYDDGLTDEKIEHLLIQDVAIAVQGVNDATKDVKLTQNQFDALVSFTFNMGVGAFRSSSMRAKIIEGDYNAVPERLMLWNKTKHPKTGLLIVVKGLTNRRKAEGELWNKI